MKRYIFIDGQLNSGGAERVLLDILRNMNYHKCEVDLLQINAGGVLINEVPKEVNVIEAWPDYSASYKLALRSSLWLGWQYPFRKRLCSVLKNKHYDVAISFLEGMPLKLHALITDVADRNYSWVHCDLNTFRYETGMFKGNEELEDYNKMTAVVCVSNDTACAFKKRFPDCTSQTKVIYNPIDIDKVIRMAEERKLENKLFTISVCGRLTPPKKIDRVVRLARKLKDENLPIRMQLIGSGELQAEIKHQVSDLDVSDIVEFVGFVRNPFPYIKASDMLLSTSYAEGFSLVICEAMTLGVPVVSTKTAGPMEILDDNKYGLLCDHDDDSIFAAVKKMFDDGQLRKHYSEVGRLRVEKFAVKNTIQQVEKL